MAGGVSGTMVTGYPKLKCLTTTSVNCVGTELAGGANAIQVSETATVPMWFAQILGFGSYTLTSTSTASARGGIGELLNVMIILDTTASMSTSTDSGCGLGSSSTRLQCAEAGVKALLTGLNPSLDYVGLMVFPGLQSTSEASNATTCGQSTSASDLQQYGNSPVYQIASLNNNFKSSNTATTLNTSSNIALAIGQGGSGCNSGIAAPGGEGTYFASAIPTGAGRASGALVDTVAAVAERHRLPQRRRRQRDEDPDELQRLDRHLRSHLRGLHDDDRDHLFALRRLDVDRAAGAAGDRRHHHQRRGVWHHDHQPDHRSWRMHVARGLDPARPGPPGPTSQHLTEGGLERDPSLDGRSRNDVAERQNLPAEPRRMPTDDRRRPRRRRRRHLGLLDRLRGRQHDRRLHDRHHLDCLGDHRPPVVLHRDGEHREQPWPH